MLNRVNPVFSLIIFGVVTFNIISFIVGAADGTRIAQGRLALECDDYTYWHALAPGFYIGCETGKVMGQKWK